MSDSHPRITRVRRETRRRLLTVTHCEMLSPHMLRVRFVSPDLTDFDSAAADDHIKLFLPDGNGGTVARDYTLRAFDTTAATLVIDFALHDDAGPATAWAQAAQPGDTLQIGGPRGSTIVADDFDWCLMIGDETAIPAIARRFEELRAGVVTTVLVAVEADGDRPQLADREGSTAIWLPRDGTTGGDAERLIAALDGIGLPSGEGYVWIAAEASVARRLRTHVVEAMGHPLAWTKASGYWTAGAAGAHEKIGDG